MASPLDALQTRIGPAPAWVWIAGGGAALYLGSRLGLFGGKAAQATIPAGARSPQTVTTVSPTPPATPAASPAPGGPPLALWQFGPVTPVGKPVVWRATTVGAANFQRTIGGTWPGGVFPNLPGPDVNQALGAYGWQWAAVPQGNDPAGHPWTPDSYAAALSGSGLGGFLPGVGGAAGRGATPRTSVTRRQDAHWSWHGHPDLKLEHVAPHFVVAGVGGAGLHPVASRAGIHPARLVALNPRAHPAPGRGGADDAVGGFTDAYAQPSVSFPRYGAQGGAADGVGGFTDAYAQPSTSFPRYGAQGGDGDQDSGGAFKGIRRRLRGRPQQVAARQGMGGPDDAVGGAQGASIPGSDAAHYRLPRVPLGHMVRAGELIRIR